MPDEKVQISRYPNRRLYAKNESKYVSLDEIEALVKSGQDVEIRDSQTGEDLTRSVLTRIIMERQPEKMSLFPVDMLHFIVRSNEMMADFLRDYFRHSLTYLSFLQRHSAAAVSVGSPMHWVKAWLDGIAPKGETNGNIGSSPDRAEQLARRVEELEERLRQFEAKQAETGK